jgi:hypothetical protein
MSRKYSVLVASSEDGLDVAAAQGSWSILRNTVRPFDTLVTNDDQTLGNIGQVRVREAGWVALGFRDA